MIAYKLTGGVLRLPKGWRALALEIALLAALFFGLRAYMTHGMASGPAPPLAGENAQDGQPLDLQTFRAANGAGKPVLVYFWGSWCGICKLMRPAVMDVAKHYPVLTVAMRSGNAEEIRAYLRDHGEFPPTLADPAGQLASRYGVRGVPAAFILDGQGRIRFVETGYTTGWGLRLRLYWVGSG